MSRKRTCERIDDNIAELKRERDHREDRIRAIQDALAEEEDVLARLYTELQEAISAVGRRPRRRTPGQTALDIVGGIGGALQGEQIRRDEIEPQERRVAQLRSELHHQERRLEEIHHNIARSQNEFSRLQCWDLGFSDDALDQYTGEGQLRYI